MLIPFRKLALVESLSWTDMFDNLPSYAEMSTECPVSPTQPNQLEMTSEVEFLKYSINILRFVKFIFKSVK